MVATSVASLLGRRVVFELECIDRMYLSLYLPGLQTPEGMVGFLRRQPGVRVYSTNAIAPLTHAFVSSIERFVERHGLDLIDFRKGERKEDLAEQYRRKFREREGVLFAGRAQEKTRVFRTIERRDARSEIPRIVRGTALPNHCCFCLLDRDFGPMFMKSCSCFPHAGKVCIDGHEWLERQLDRRGIAYRALDNGLLECADPRRAQRIADQLDERKIEAVVRKWSARLPHPFQPRHRADGCRCQISMLLEEEIQDRRSRRVQRRLEEARFRQVKTLAELDPKELPSGITMERLNELTGGGTSRARRASSPSVAAARARRTCALRWASRRASRASACAPSPRPSW